LRSGEHCDHKLAVEVRRGTLWYTLILSLLFGSGGEHSDQKLAVKVRRRRRWRKRTPVDMKSNNPHQTGGEKVCLYEGL